MLPEKRETVITTANLFDGLLLWAYAPPKNGKIIGTIIEGDHVGALIRLSSGQYAIGRQGKLTPSLLRPDYCTQGAPDCRHCSLSNYGRDCRNNRIGGGSEADPFAMQGD